MFGKTVNTYEFNNTEPRANILPGSIRRFNDKIGSQKLPGRYTIESNLGYSSGGGELLSAKASFWYMPVWAILVVVALILAVVGGIVWLSRKFNRGSRKSVK